MDARGSYNRFDEDVHKDRFDAIKRHYVIGDTQDSRFLSERRIRQLAPSFVGILNVIFGTRKDSVVRILGRAGRKMSEEQVKSLLEWLND